MKVNRLEGAFLPACLPSLPACKWSACLSACKWSSAHLVAHAVVVLGLSRPRFAARLKEGRALRLAEDHARRLSAARLHLLPARRHEGLARPRAVPAVDLAQARPHALGQRKRRRPALVVVEEAHGLGVLSGARLRLRGLLSVARSRRQKSTPESRRGKGVWRALELDDTRSRRRKKQKNKNKNTEPSSL